MRRASSSASRAIWIFTSLARATMARNRGSQPWQVSRLKQRSSNSSSGVFMALVSCVNVQTLETARPRISTGIPRDIAFRVRGTVRFHARHRRGYGRAWGDFRFHDASRRFGPCEGPSSGGDPGCLNVQASRFAGIRRRRLREPAYRPPCRRRAWLCRRCIPPRNRAGPYRARRMRP